MSAVSDVVLGCSACSVKVSCQPSLETKSDAGHVTVTVSIPGDWRGSYGASGRGSFVTCPRCTARKIRVDDVDGCIDHGGFVND